MNSSIRAGLALLAGLLTLGAAIYFALPAIKPVHDAQATSWVPGDADIVLTLEIAGHDMSPITSLLEKQGLIMSNASEGDCAVLRQLRQVALWMPSDDSQAFGVAATGDLTMQQLWLCARQTISARGGQPIRRTQGDFLIVRDAAIPGAGDGLALWNRGGVMLLGTEALRKQMSRAHAQPGQSVTSSNRHQTLRSLLTAPQTVLIATARMTPWLTNQLAKLVGGGVSEQVRDIDGVGASLTTTAHTAHLGVALTCRHPQTCRDLGKVLVGRIRLLGALMFRHSSLLSDMLGQTQLSAGVSDKPHVLLTTSTPIAQLPLVIRQLPLLGREAPRAPMPLAPAAQQRPPVASSSAPASTPQKPPHANKP